MFSSQCLVFRALRGYAFSALVITLLCSTAALADSVPRLAGVLGLTGGGKPTLDVKDGPHRGTYAIERDIKGLVLYPGTHIVAFDATISGDNIDFQKFEWERLEDFMLANADLLPHWELPARFAKRDITGPALTKLPYKISHDQPPTRGIAQRLTVHVGSELHTYQIRYYEFQSSSAAAMFADRWSGKKGVTRDTAEHFRRAFDKIAVWVLNADDERTTPDYWTSRFILESLSRKALIALDTSIIFNHKNADAVIFNADPDTVGPGDTLVLVGQGFSPFMRDNVVTTAGSQPIVFPTVSSTSHQITVEVPRSLGVQGQVQDVQVGVLVHNYAATNPIAIHIRRP